VTSSSLRGKRCLVTGAGGFIGSHLVEALVRTGAEVRAFVHYNAIGTRGWLDRSELAADFEVVAGDLTDRDSMRPAFQGVEVVFHLGALIPIPYSYVAPQSFLRTNAEGTLNALQLAREEGVARFVHTSTSEVYGTARSVPIDEAHPLQAQSPYAASKIAADKVAEAMALSFDIHVTTVRPFNTYGPRQSARAVIPVIITQALDGHEIRLGSLHPTRDFTFATDTAQGFLRAAEAALPPATTVNLGTGQEIAIGDLAERIVTITGSGAAVVVERGRTRPEGSEVDRLLADNRLATRLMGWSPTVSLDDGLAETVAWFRANLEKYHRGVYQI
jgi:NAD dependent epimerase/dehydratase